MSLISKKYGWAVNSISWSSENLYWLEKPNGGFLAIKTISGSYTFNEREDEMLIVFSKLLISTFIILFLETLSPILNLKICLLKI